MPNVAETSTVWRGPEPFAGGRLSVSATTSPGFREVMALTRSPEVATGRPSTAVMTSPVCSTCWAGEPSTTSMTSAPALLASPNCSRATLVAVSLESAISCRLTCWLSLGERPWRITSSFTMSVSESSQPTSACHTLMRPLTDTVVYAIPPSGGYIRPPSTEISVPVGRTAPAPSV